MKLFKKLSYLFIFKIFFSIAFFNFAGVTVTKELSATTRMVLDSVRTLVIWIFSIPLFGEKFIPVQVILFFYFIYFIIIVNRSFNLKTI